MCATVVKAYTVEFISKDHDILCHTEFFLGKDLPVGPSINSQLEFESSITASVTEGDAQRKNDFYIYSSPMSYGLFITLTNPTDGVGAVTLTLPEATSAVAFKIPYLFSFAGEDNLEPWVTVNESQQFNLAFLLGGSESEGWIAFASDDDPITSVKFHVTVNFGENTAGELTGDNEQPNNDGGLEEFYLLHITAIRYGSNECLTASPTVAPTPSAPSSPTAYYPADGDDVVDVGGGGCSGKGCRRKLRRQQRRTAHTKTASNK